MKIFALLFFPISSVLMADVTVDDDGRALKVSFDGKHVLSYQHAVFPPPDGADPKFARSGFVHPLLEPAGSVVTGIHPGDHYHHLGLWHPWTKTTVEGKAVDFWNLKKGEGTMRFVKFLETTGGQEKGGFVARQEHLVLAGGKETVAIEEDFGVTVHANDDPFVVDYEWVQRPQFDVELPAYRYGGGIGFRGHPSWGKKSTTYLTSEGKTWEDGHATRAKWCRISGPGKDGGKATVVLMNHTSNHDHPQRMRVHPGPYVFFNFVPQQEKDWKLEVGKEYEMRYRILVFSRIPDEKEIADLWAAYEKE